MDYMSQWPLFLSTDDASDNNDDGQNMIVQNHWHLYQMNQNL